jgi:RNA polymerase sigma factor (sigma-70 family)
MAEILETSRDGTAAPSRDVPVSSGDVADWFVREVLPLEAVLTQYLRHNWHNRSDIADLRQEVYVRVCESAQQQFPDHTKRFVLTTARNLLINRVRREQIVPIDVIADVDALGVAIDMPGPDRIVMARDELKRLQAALDRLPPRSREAVVLGHVEGLSGREIATRMGITKGMVSVHLANGMRALANMLYGETERRSEP